MFSLSSIPPVTKNILLLNILFYIATLVLAGKGIDLIQLLGAHYVNSPLFEPYQIVTYFFMHSKDFFHILFNMLMLVMFGAHLERIWGPKRFFIFYIASAIGAFALYNIIGVYQIIQLKEQLTQLGYDLTSINQIIANNELTQIPLLHPDDTNILSEYLSKSIIPMVGASGAIYGIMAGFAYLFPNTELMLLFPPIPVKAKWLISVYFVIELYSSFQNYQGDNVAHLAHVGGGITGFILVFIWNKNRSTFY
ncbi:MAG: rhomboid family intramembrane serine protease [Crocinitomicaceae bacterium]|nr:rhomboid family intramembrane serine protease [Crocinitomicaceae bacterium]